MISTKALFSRNGKQATEIAMEPVEPLTVEGEALADEVSTYLSRASEEQRALLSENDELGRQMADLLAAKELGRPVDPESVIAVAERRSVVKRQLEAVEYRIAGLLTQQDSLKESKNERVRDALLPELQKSGELGEALIQQFYLRMCELSESLEAIVSNHQHFADLSREWNRVSQGKGHGVTAPREVWDFFLPEVKRQATYSNPAGRRTLAQQVERTLWLDPQERREQFMRDNQKHAEESERIKREAHNHYLHYLQSRRIAETNGITNFPDYEFVVPGELKFLKSDLEWTGPR